MNFTKKLDRFINPKIHMKYWYCYFLKYFRINNKVILIESYHGKTIGDSGLVFAKEIQRLYPGRYTVYFASNDLKKHQKFVDANKLDVKLIEIDTMKYARLLATAGYIISNASLPIYHIRREGQVYLQTWHGTPLKTLGKQMRMGIESMYNVQHNFLQASHITFPNEFTKNAIMTDYNLEKLYTGKAVMSGYPRNKVFMEKGRDEEIRKQLKLEDKTVYAYMPTWRGTSNRTIDNGKYISEIKDIFSKLDKTLRDDQIFYVNFHPILKGTVSFKKYKHIKPFPDKIDNYTFLNCVDALITDYSSVFFDFSLTKKPIMLFMYDYDQYMADRGMYMDVRDLPFRQIYDADEFCEAVRDDVCLSDDYSNTEYYDTYFKYDSADNAEKLLDLIINGNEEDLTIIDYTDNKGREINVFSPKKKYQESDFRTLSKVATGDNDVALMYRDEFKLGISPLLYDRYNDDFNYVITSNDPPRTYYEQLMSNLGKEKYKKKIYERDVARCFPGLKVPGGFESDFGLIAEGCHMRVKDMRLIDVREVIPADSLDVKIRYDLPEDLRPVEAFITDNKNTLVSRRALTDDEIANNTAYYDFKGLLEDYSVFRKENCIIGLICRDMDGQEKAAVFVDKEKCEKAIRLQKREQRNGSMYAPSIAEAVLPTDYRRADIKAITNSSDEGVKRRLDGLDMTPVDTRMLLIPNLSMDDKDHFIRVRISMEKNAIYQMSDPARLISYSCRGDRLTVKAFLRGWKESDIASGNLIFDSDNEDIVIPMETVTKAGSGGTLIILSLRLTEDLPLKPLRWHCKVRVTFGNESYDVRIRNHRPGGGLKMKIRNIQCVLGDHVLFPYIGKGNILKFTYREKNSYDTSAIRRREALAMVIYLFAGLWLRRKKIYIVYEKFSKTAQDNSFYFFRYCIENLPESERKRFFYVIDKNSPDYSNVEKYGSNVLQFMGLGHMVYSMTSKLVISTDSLPHLYAWQTKPSLVYDRIHSKGVFFLQHGVTAMKRVAHLFGKNSANPMKYFVATSRLEQEIVVSEFKYKEENVPVVGFTRWDVLEDKEDKNDRFILMMPTWRAWLEDVSDEEFIASDYFRNYSDLLRSDSLKEILRENDLKMILYLHPKFAQYLETFKSEVSERIIPVAFGEKPLNDIMMRCALLITDYSSVCWDVMYMDKPVIFYQFDCQKYLDLHGSYIDLKNGLPSTRVEELDDVITALREYVDDDFKIRPEYRSELEKFYEFKDSDNSRRTYEYLMMQEEGKK